MTESHELPLAIGDALRRLLTDAELAQAVVYVAAGELPAGAHVQLPRVDLDIPWPAYLAFVDREPLANWSHSARYLVFNPGTGASLSHEARFPPFGPDRRERWLLAYRAPSVPDAAIHDPH